MSEAKLSKETKRSSPIMLNIVNLPDDVLFLILSYCDVKSLGRLCRVCKRFHGIASQDCVWHNHSKRTSLIENPHNSLKHKRKEETSVKEKYRISKNWIQGNYEESLLLRYNVKQLPWLQLHEDALWVSRKNEIKCFKKRNGEYREEYCCRARDLQDDVSKFVIRDGTVISGCRDGSLVGWQGNTGNSLFHYKNIHDCEIHAVDFHGNSIVSGSRDGSVKIVSTLEDDNFNRIKSIINAKERVWSVAVSPDGSSFTCGTAGCLDEVPIITYDINTCTSIQPLQYNHRRGAGILDVKYETPQLLFTCGYDCFLRLWDLRTQSCVGEWEEPFDAAVYCFQSDGHMTMLTGTAMHGLARLWDKRTNKKSIQMYYTGKRMVNSPVYSIAHDGKKIYSALDRGVNMLDFTTLNRVT